MPHLTVRSFIPDNFGQIAQLEVSAETKIPEVIGKICKVYKVNFEPKMYLKMEEGAKVKEITENSGILELRTWKISRFRWICAISSLILSILSLPVILWTYFDEKRKNIQFQ